MEKMAKRQVCIHPSAFQVHAFSFLLFVLESPMYLAAQDLMGCSALIFFSKQCGCSEKICIKCRRKWLTFCVFVLFVYVKAFVLLH